MQKLKRWVWILVILAILIGFGGGIWSAAQRAYQLGCMFETSPLFPITNKTQTLNAPTLRFVVLGDFGNGSLAQQKVASAIEKVCLNHGCDMMLTTGDNFYPTGVTSVYDPKWWNYYEQLYGGLKIPVFPVLGNHDVKQHPIHQVAYSLLSTSWNLPNYRYQFNAGPAQFHMINTNCGPWEWWNVKNWLKSDAGWQIIVGHSPIYGTSNHGDNDWLTRILWTWFYSEADMVLAGNNHVLEHLTHPDRKTQHIISGAGGKVEDDRKRGSSRERASAATSNFRYDEAGFVWITLKGAQATVVFYDENARSIYQFTHDKSTQAANAGKPAAK